MNVTTAEQELAAAQAATTPANTTTAAVAPAAATPAHKTHVISPEAADKLRAARDKYWADVRSGKIKPPVRTKKPAVKEEKPADNASMVPQTNRNPLPIDAGIDTSKLGVSQIRIELSDGPAPTGNFIYLTKEIGVDRTVYHAENSAYQRFALSQKWVDRDQKAEDQVWINRDQFFASLASQHITIPAAIAAVL